EYPNDRLPLLELKNFITPGLVTQYHSFQEGFRDIPCENQFEEVQEIEKATMLEKLLIERLHQKSNAVLGLLEENKGDWEETTWQLVARYFGARINADPFQKLAQRLPIRLLLKHRDNLLQLEALLFGTAGLIPNEKSCSYVNDLRNEFKFLSHKYQFGNNSLRPLEWKLLRLRPAGFPTVRMAQLAALIHRNGNLFSTLTHFHFGKPAGSLVPLMRSDAINLLIINAAVPLLAAFAHKTDQSVFLDKAVSLLEELPGENNKILRKWKALGLRLNSAANSQGA